MHVGAILIFEGPPPHYDDLVEHVRSRLHLVPRFRQKLVVPPLEAGRPLWADDVNFNLDLPHPPHRAARAGRRGAAEAARRAGLLPAARPLEAALGAVAGAGPRARPLRDPDQDPPRDGRRGLRRRHRHRPLRPRAGAGADASWRTTGCRSPSRARPSWSRAASPTPSRPRSSWPSARSRRVRNPETTARKVGRGAGGRRRGRRRLRRPGAGRAAERGDRAAPALRLGALGAGDLQADQGRARRHRQRRRPRRRHRRPARAGCTAAASAPRASSCGRWCRSRSAARTSAATSATGSRLMRGPLPVYIEDPVRRLRDDQRGDGRA